MSMIVRRWKSRRWTRQSSKPSSVWFYCWAEGATGSWILFWDKEGSLISPVHLRKKILQNEKMHFLIDFRLRSDEPSFRSEKHRFTRTYRQCVRHGSTKVRWSRWNESSRHWRREQWIEWRRFKREWSRRRRIRRSIDIPVFLNKSFCFTILCLVLLLQVLLFTICFDSHFYSWSVLLLRVSLRRLTLF